MIESGKNCRMWLIVINPEQTLVWNRRCLIGEISGSDYNNCIWDECWWWYEQWMEITILICHSWSFWGECPFTVQFQPPKLNTPCLGYLRDFQGLMRHEQMAKRLMSELMDFDDTDLGTWQEWLWSKVPLIALIQVAMPEAEMPIDGLSDSPDTLIRHCHGWLLSWEPDIHLKLQSICVAISLNLPSPEAVNPLSFREGSFAPCMVASMVEHHQWSHYTSLMEAHIRSSPYRASSNDS